MKPWILALVLSAAIPLGGAAQERVFACDFEKAPVGKVPDEFLVLDGAFSVVEEAGGGRLLELPGAPLETFGVLFGPSAKEGLEVSARIFGTSKGRRFPVLAVGLNGATPYRLQSTPSKKALELYKGDDLLASVSFAWESGSWTEFRLRLVPSGAGQWTLSGKAWKRGTPEPASWSLTSELKEEPAAGKASVWGKPYSETPIRFDDLVVSRIK
ncbi:MAG TPA: hypothetical protein DCM86_02895 [Verrucomicrobiales bacterium]|nr:hypothetical protein [Verrucomicrobiales bacterium]